MKKFISLILAISFIFAAPTLCFAESGTNSLAEKKEEASSTQPDFGFSVRGALLMEAQTGAIIFAENEYFAASPASVTKIMTLLLVCEALEEGRFSLSDKVTISSHAASMGGSQVFLEEGEEMSVEELIKCTVIASANDAAVALAELTAGSESAFVGMMNRRASELGLKSTAFENATGLDDTVTDHYSCAMDIAVMSRELIGHDIILKYSSLWQDTIRDGSFTLTNTNRLVRYYEGCNGLKTGSTDKAGYCVSTTAVRGDMQLIAVIMGAESRDERNAAARALLDYGFASYGLYKAEESFVENIPVVGGTCYQLPVYSTPFVTLVDRGGLSRVEQVYDIPESLSAPLAAGERVGQVKYMLDGQELGCSELIVRDECPRITLPEIFLRALSLIFCGKIL